MIDEMKTIAYTVSQGLRVSRFLGQSIIGNLALGRKVPAEHAQDVPDRAAVLKELLQLFERDLAYIRAGVYKMPSDLVEDPVALAKSAVSFFLDLPWVRNRQSTKNVKDFSAEVPQGDFPKYYAQNFHFQTNGYLSQKSAELYDYQVETVFAGGGDAMRRQALVPLRRFLGNRADQMCMLDVGCGTGRFLKNVKENHPGLSVTGLDLSPWYLRKAARTLEKFRGASFVEANAEEMPFRDAQFDVVSCIFVLHELPRLVRARVLSEAARVLKPNGILILVDSIQMGDKPQFDGSLRLFPLHNHEPYYRDYVEQDLGTVFEELGLVTETVDMAFFSKITTLRASKEVTTKIEAPAARPKKARVSKAKLTTGPQI